MTEKFIVRCIGVSIDHLAWYLKKNWHGFQSKDYELLVAIFIARFQERQSGRRQRVGLPIKYRHSETVQLSCSKKNLEMLIAKYIDEDTPVDFLIGDHAQQKKKRKDDGFRNAKGQAFQVKRFFVSNGDQTKKISEYLIKNIRKKYQHSQATLVLLFIPHDPDSAGTFNLKTLYEVINSHPFPFERVVFITFSDSSVIIGEFFPNVGKTILPLRELIWPLSS